jgi:hypothetical protein
MITSYREFLIPLLVLGRGWHPPGCWGGTWVTMVAASVTAAGTAPASRPGNGSEMVSLWRQDRPDGLTSWADYGWCLLAYPRCW